MRICLLTNQDLFADPFPADDWPCDPRPFYPEAEWDVECLGDIELLDDDPGIGGGQHLEFSSLAWRAARGNHVPALRSKFSSKSQTNPTIGTCQEDRGTRWVPDVGSCGRCSGEQQGSKKPRFWRAKCQ